MPSSGQCPAGSNKVAVQFGADVGRDPDPRDFHFARQKPDGSWCEKHGERPERTFPEEPSPLPRYKACGYLCIKDGYNTDPVKR